MRSRQGDSATGGSTMIASRARGTPLQPLRLSSISNTDVSALVSQSTTRQGLSKQLSLNTNVTQLSAASFRGIPSSTTVSRITSVATLSQSASVNSSAFLEDPSETFEPVSSPTENDTGLRLSPINETNSSDNFSPNTLNGFTEAEPSGNGNKHPGSLSRTHSRSSSSSGLALTSLTNTSVTTPLPSVNVKNISVSVRLRPLNSREKDLLASSTNSGKSSELEGLTYDSDTIQTTGPKARVFTLDAVIPSSSSQADVFRERVQPLVDASFSGYNTCIFAYGQTGSGKTFTMSGPDLDAGTSAEAISRLQLSESRGVIPRTLQHIFSLVGEESATTGCRYYVTCTFLEIYNEKVIDLLQGVTGTGVFTQTHTNMQTFLANTLTGNFDSLGGKDTKDTKDTKDIKETKDVGKDSVRDLPIRESQTGDTYVEGLTVVPVTSAAQALSLLLQGTSRRKVASTKMNATSSRSHSVFALTLIAVESSGTRRSSKLNLVDLAGSENAQATGATGMQQTEASNINRSLTTLGSVMMILARNSEQGRKNFVPYRDSKLTYLLRESIGGNSKLCLIANISSSPTNLQETISTLTFATNARKLKKKVNSNVTVGEGGTLALDKTDPFELLSVAFGDDNAFREMIVSQQKDLHRRFGQLQALHRLAMMMRSVKRGSENISQDTNDVNDDYINENGEGNRSGSRLKKVRQ